jgi:ketosteroid isomerase-like protein
MLDPDIEWDVSGAGAWMPADLTAVYWGHERLLTYWQHWLESWRDLQFEIQDVCGVADDVLVLIRNQRQWGRHSGILTELPPFDTFREGKIVSMRAFPDHESALEAVGLAG